MTYQAVLAALVVGNGLSKSCGKTVRKLSESDKRDILNLYRQPGETTSTLADRYDVSNSTISRFLKTTLPEDEYEELIQQKRAARTPNSGKMLTVSSLQSPEEEPEVIPSPQVVAVEPSLADEVTPSSKRPRRRSATASPPEPETRSQEAQQLQLLDVPAPVPAPSISQSQDVVGKPVRQPERLGRPASRVDSSPSPLDEDSGVGATALAEMLGEDLLDESEDLNDLDGLDDEDLEDLDEDDLDDEAPVLRRRVSAGTLVQVLPLSEASLPKTCYLVIDRASELITKPLREFGDLGQIPTGEVQQKTLPVFDNHRVARRFSTKRDRVIKIPDSRLLQKAHSQLQAKGITRLLVDGHVYSLSPTNP